MGGNMLVLVNTSFGYIIGERINKDNKDVLTIKEPRNLVIANDKETGQHHFAVGEFPWKTRRYKPTGESCVFRCDRGSGEKTVSSGCFRSGPCRFRRYSEAALR